MGKKKDCFGLEDYVCMTPNCPYAKECIQVVWQKRLDRVIAKKNRDAAAAPAQRADTKAVAQKTRRTTGLRR